jgi:hypothetical protein
MRALRQDLWNAGYVYLLVVVLVCLYFAFRGEFSGIEFVKNKDVSSEEIVDVQP